MQTGCNPQNKSLFIRRKKAQLVRKDGLLKSQKNDLYSGSVEYLEFSVYDLTTRYEDEYLMPNAKHETMNSIPYEFIIIEKRNIIGIDFASGVIYCRR
jgi:hypothetical protein